MGIFTVHIAHLCNLTHVNVMPENVSISLLIFYYRPIIWSILLAVFFYNNLELCYEPLY